MKRPHLSLSIAELTALAEAATSLQTLRQIKAELSHRTTPSARRLDAIVRERLAATEAKATAKPAGPNPSQAPGAQREGASPVRRRPTPPKPKNQPTAEQVVSINEFMTGESLKVTAFAGAGKTSTLVQMAQQREGAGLYLAFNKAIADEARNEFPPSVDCRTTHSIALKFVRAGGVYSQDKLFTQIGAKQLAATLGLKPKSFANAMTFTDVQQAHLFSKTIRQFCQSADDVLSAKHVKKLGRLLGLKAEVQKEAVAWTVEQSNALWQRMTNSQDLMPLGHDGYLKLWSLSRPILDYQYVLVDEAQDTNPAVMSVLEHQRTQIVYVGDQHQQIYAWRGAMNAMAEARTARSAYLTQSFRFGAEIADAATGILRTLGEARTVRGNPNVLSRIKDFGDAKAVLTRTNAMTISEVIDALGRGQKPYILGGADDMLDLVKAVYDLSDGKPSSRPEFFGFTTWDQVVSFSDTDEGEELRPFVSLVQKYGQAGLYRALKSTVAEEKDADITLSTAHKSKGRQWSAVRIADDFSGVQSEDGSISEEEARLFYVAITRAQQELIVSTELLSGFKRKQLPPKARRGQSKAEAGQPRTNRPAAAADISPTRGVPPTPSRNSPVLEAGASIRTTSPTSPPSTSSRASEVVRVPGATMRMPTSAPGAKTASRPPVQPVSSVRSPASSPIRPAATTDVMAGNATVDSQDVPPEPPKPKKKGFFARLFG